MSNYCMNCGEWVSELGNTDWREGASLYFDDGVDGQHEGILHVVVCPFCDHQQIDVSNQYGNLPVSEANDAEGSEH